MKVCLPEAGEQSSSRSLTGISFVNHLLLDDNKHLVRVAVSKAAGCRQPFVIEIPIVGNYFYYSKLSFCVKLATPL
jgi:hypothetical protein